MAKKENSPKKENIPKKEKKRKKEQKISPMMIGTILIIVVVIVIAAVFLIQSTNKKNQNQSTNRSLGNYTVPTTNIDQKDFVCPTKKYLNCVPPILLSDDFCMNPYRQWIEKNCPDVKIFE